MFEGLTAEQILHTVKYCDFTNLFIECTKEENRDDLYSLIDWRKKFFNEKNKRKLIQLLNKKVLTLKHLPLIDRIALAIKISKIVKSRNGVMTIIPYADAQGLPSLAGFVDGNGFVYAKALGDDSSQTHYDILKEIFVATDLESSFQERYHTEDDFKRARYAAERGMIMFSNYYISIPNKAVNYPDEVFDILSSNFCFFNLCFYTANVGFASDFIERLAAARSKKNIPNDLILRTMQKYCSLLSKIKDKKYLEMFKDIINNEYIGTDIDITELLLKFVFVTGNIDELELIKKEAEKAFERCQKREVLDIISCCQHEIEKNHTRRGTFDNMDVSNSDPNGLDNRCTMSNRTIETKPTERNNEDDSLTV